MCESIRVVKRANRIEWNAVVVEKYSSSGDLMVNGASIVSCNNHSAAVKAKASQGYNPDRSSLTARALQESLRRPPIELSVYMA